MDGKLAEIIENEWYLVRHSGETPEIALHSALYFLTRAKDGPRVTLGQEHFHMLQKAAIERFSEIILRDLQHANAGTKIYRGLGRSIINYRRFSTFCLRQKVDPGEICRQARKALEVFLTTEMTVVRSGERPSIINCSLSELHSFSEELGLNLTGKFPEIAEFCLSAD